MVSINEISSSHITNLKDIELTELLRKLLNLEVSKCQIQRFEIHVPENITTADGGEDGLAVIIEDVKKSNWLLNQYTLFQCKASDLSPKDCYDEVLVSVKLNKPKKLKSRVEQLVEKNGLYILFSSAIWNSEQKDRRIEKLREAFNDAGYPNYNNIKIYDATKIKEWSNQFVNAVTYIQRCNSISRPSAFRTWEEWERDMSGSNIPYKLNDLLRQHIEDIRSAVVEQQAIRIIGHSGLGKTRLVLETFRSSSGNDQLELLKNQVVYFDLGINGDLPAIANYIISHTNQTGIIIIDNCDEKSHNVLVGLVENIKNFKLITIDFTSSEHSSSYLKLSRDNQKDIVQQIIDERFSTSLPKTDREFLANLAEGYPQMAVLFANSIENRGLANLSNQLPKDFIKKLIFQRDNENLNEYEVIKSCSILSYFGFIDDNINSILDDSKKETLNNEMDFVRSKLCSYQVSKKEFYRTVLKYKSFGIIEQRGSYALVKPTPLAMSLAAEWWLETPHDEIKDLLIELKDQDLGNRLIERLKGLDQLDKAKQIVYELWGPNRPFSTAEVLNTRLGSLLFRHIVEVNHKASAKALETTFLKKSKEDLLLLKEGRRNLVWALEKLCFRDDTFDSSAKILCSFAVAETETWGNNATGQFTKLFQVFLPGTEANLQSRINVLEWALEKQDDNYTAVAIKAMAKALYYGSFTRVGGAEKQGSNTILTDYMPTREEIHIYWEKVLSILKNIAISSTSNASIAKDVIAMSIRTFIVQNEVDLILDTIHTIINRGENFWEKALNELKSTISLDKVRINKIVKDKIKKLIEDLSPKDIINQLFIKVSRPEWDYFENDELGNVIDKPKLEAEGFAVYLIENNIDIINLFPSLLKGEQRQGFNFGKKLIELTKGKDDLIDKAIEVLSNIPNEEQNPEFLGGLIAGCTDEYFVKSKIRVVIKNERVQHHSFYLTKVTGSSAKNINLLFQLVNEKKVPVTYFKVFQYGGALNNLTAKEIELLTKKLYRYDQPGQWTALSLLYMYCYGEEIKQRKHHDLFKSFITRCNYLVIKDKSLNYDVYHWADSVRKILEQKNEVNFAQAITEQLVEFSNEPDFDYSIDNYLTNVIYILISEYFKDIWPILGKGIVGDYLGFYHLKHMIEDRSAWREQNSLLFDKEENNRTILDWCRNYPDTAPMRIANFMPLGIVEGIDLVWHPLSKSIIDEFGNNEDVLNEVESNMGTFGFIGSTVPYYENQRTLLKQLMDHKSINVREWATKMLEYTEKKISRERLDNEEDTLR